MTQQTTTTTTQTPGNGTQKVVRGQLQATLINAIAKRKNGADFKALTAEGAVIGSSRKSVEQCVYRLVQKGVLKRVEGKYYRASTPKTTKTKTTKTKSKAKAKAKAKTKGKATRANVVAKKPRQVNVKTTKVDPDIALAQSLAQFKARPRADQDRIDYLAGLIQDGTIRVTA